MSGSETGRRLDEAEFGLLFCRCHDWRVDSFIIVMFPWRVIGMEKAESPCRGFRLRMESSTEIIYARQSLRFHCAEGALRQGRCLHTLHSVREHMKRHQLRSRSRAVILHTSLPRVRRKVPSSYIVCDSGSDAVAGSAVAVASLLVLYRRRGGRGKIRVDGVSEQGPQLDKYLALSLIKLDWTGCAINCGSV